MTFTPPAGGSTRLSTDVWTLICSYAEENGNSSTREAIEQIIRQTIGDAKAFCCHCAEQVPVVSDARSAPETGVTASDNAAAALDALIND